MAADVVKDEIEITELVDFKVTRVDGVGSPANGFPVLMMKGLPRTPVAKGARDCPKCDKSYDADHTGSTCENCGTDLPDAPASKAADDAVDCPTCKGDGKIMGDKRDCPDCDAKGQVSPAKAKTLAAKSLARGILADLGSVAKAVGADGQVDEAPDIDKANQILALLGEAIAAEAQEMAAGQAGEADDILELACAANAVRCWRDGEQAVSLGDVMPASVLMQSAAEDAAKADLSTAKVNDLPDSAFAYIEDGGTKDDEGKTTPRSKRHFPVHDEAHARNALSRAPQSPFGEKAMPKIKAAAKRFGIGGDGDGASKSVIAPEGTSVDTVTQDGQIAKAVEDAIAKATAPLEERIKALDAELAKVLALPRHGGPVQTVVTRAQAAGDSEQAAMAKRIRDTAATIDDPATRSGYLQWAREVEAGAKTS